MGIIQYFGNKTFRVAVIVLLACTISPGIAWTTGRATFYGNEPWYWDIHHGSCGFGYQWPDQSTGWDIAAMSDSMPEYGGSCGHCYEVQCDPGMVRDGYGQTMDRKGVCKGGSVVVRTTDTCPCQEASNYYSNKRWCCGDQNHFDLSVWAFQKLTDMKWGVVPIKYRRVDCGYRPADEASGASFPGVFPPVAVAKERPDFDWQRYFPGGGYPSPKAKGWGKQGGLIGTDEFIKMVKGGTPSSSSSSSSSPSSSSSSSYSSSPSSSQGPDDDD